MIANGARAVAIRPAPVPDVRGSRSEGAAEPLDYLDEFRSYAPDEIERVFSTNLERLIEGRAD